jgi:hypothetical protein
MVLIGGQGQRKGELYRKALATSDLSIALPCLCAESALSPFLFSNNHLLSSIYTSYIESHLHSRAPSFLSFSPPPLGSTFFACSLITGLVPSIPYPSLATILKHRSCPLLASSPISGLQRKSDKRYNRVCLFSQTPSLDLSSGRSFDPTSCALVTFRQLYTTEQFFVFFILLCRKQNSSPLPSPIPRAVTDSCTMNSSYHLWTLLILGRISVLQDHTSFYLPNQ